MFLYKVCRGLELGFWLDFYVIEGYFAGFVCEKFFVYFLRFCSVCLGVWVFLYGEGRDVWKILG